MVAIQSPFYQIWALYKGALFSPEINDGEASFERTVDAILTGDVPFEIVKIFKVDVQAGTWVEASDDIARAVSQRSHKEGIEPAREAKAFLEAHGFDGHEEPLPHGGFLSTKSPLAREAA